MTTSPLLLITTLIIISTAPTSVVASSSFEPYQLNGGLVTAIAGQDYCLIAADTRMMDGGYQIYSRRLPRIFGFQRGWVELPEGSEEQVVTITDSTLLAAAGCHADCIALQRQLLYQSKARGNDMELPTPNVAQLLSQTLYARRTFPYYSFCVVAGLKDGCGQAYQYDAIGSREQVAVATAGTGRELLQPILDRLLSSSNQDESVVTDTADQALQSVIKAYQAVAEREISVGDSLLICVLQGKPKGESTLVTCKVQLVELKRH